jgi:molecular chaperone DnaJ
MSKRDYYEILEVSVSVTQEELKRSYRKKAMEHHPDRNPGNKEAEEKFKELNEAYEVLSNEQKRAAYDKYGHSAFQQGGGGHSSSQGYGFSGNFSDIFEDMFGDFMRGSGSRQQELRGDDLKYDLELTLEEAFAGVRKEIKLSRLSACTPCHGSGAEDSSGSMTCSKCRGSGMMRIQQGFFMMERTCDACRGAGRIIKNPCISCRGSGQVRQQTTLSVTIPAGVDQGTRMRLAQEGNAGVRGGASGDLYVFLHIKAHDLFQRDGDAIQCRVPIPMVMAALGGSVEIPTIEGGQVEVKIPAGTQHGDQFRIKGKGMSIYGRSGRGDMYVQASIEIPRHLTKKQIEVLEQFSGTDSYESRHPESTGFWDKVKSLWGETPAEPPKKKKKRK